MNVAQRAAALLEDTRENGLWPDHWVMSCDVEDEIISNIGPETPLECGRLCPETARLLTFALLPVVVDQASPVSGLVLVRRTIEFAPGFTVQPTAIALAEVRVLRKRNGNELRLALSDIALLRVGTRLKGKHLTTRHVLTVSYSTGWLRVDDASHIYPDTILTIVTEQ